MAVKIKGYSTFKVDNQRSKSKRTSIGNSKNTYPKSKQAKKQYKKYSGQGK
jgi:hypothetical protein|tara:strand:- start:9 stop:161 length:153 start_codon:yes stop_codon:yes gene_type:complete